MKNEPDRNEPDQPIEDDLTPRIADMPWGLLFWAALVALIVRLVGWFPFVTESALIGCGTAFAIKCLADEWEQNALIAMGYWGVVLISYRAWTYGYVGWWLPAVILAVGALAYTAIKVIERWLNAMAVEEDEQRDASPTEDAR